MNTNEIDSIYIGSNEVTKLYSGGVLVWEKEVPIGRTFNINPTNAPGDDPNTVVLDGDDETKQWYPLQENDRFIVDPGTYPYIGFVNIEEAVTITCEEDVSSKTLYLSGRQKNVKYDFVGNTDGYGLKLTVNELENASIVFDEYSTGGYENLELSGIHITVPSNYSQTPTLLKHNGSSFNGVAAKNCKLDRWKITGNDKLVTGGIMLGSEANTSNNNGYTEGIEISNIVLDGPIITDRIIYLRNTDSAHVHHITLDEINKNWAVPQHARLILIEGNGIIENCSANDYLGTIGVIHGFTRGSNPKQSIIRNLKGTNNIRYSIAEMDTKYQLSGFTYTNIKATGISCDTIGQDGYAEATCVAIGTIPTGGQLVVNNCLCINGKGNQGVGFPTNAYNGSPTSQSGNRVYNNREMAQVSELTLIPNAGSPVIGAGVHDENLLTDFYGNQRPNPPSIGACEPQ